MAKDDKTIKPEDDNQSGFLEGPGGQIKPVYKEDELIPVWRDAAGRFSKYVAKE